MNHIACVILFLLASLTAFAQSMRAGETVSDSYGGNTAKWSTMRSAWIVIKESDNMVAQKYLDTLDAQPLSKIHEVNSINAFLRVALRLLLFKNDGDLAKNEAFRESVKNDLIKTLATRLMAPEVLRLTAEFNHFDGKQHSFLGYDCPVGLYQDCLAAFTPVMVGWGSKIPSTEIQTPAPLVQPTLGADGHWSAYPISLPIFKSKLSSQTNEDSFIMLRVARNYEAADLPRHAYLAYWEHFYAERSFSRLSLLPDEKAIPKGSHLSVEAALIWERMAANAHKSGNFDLAQAFLTRAAVFGDNDCFRRCLSTWADWRLNVEASGEGIAKEISNEDKFRLLGENVDMYMEVGLHPRAWALIAEFPEFFDDPKGLIASVKESWRETSKAADNMSRPLYRYGKRIDKSTDLFEISIPWPCSPEVAKKYSMLWDALSKNIAAPQSTPEMGVEKEIEDDPPLPKASGGREE